MTGDGKSSQDARYSARASDWGVLEKTLRNGIGAD